MISHGAVLLAAALLSVLVRPAAAREPEGGLHPPDHEATVERSIRSWNETVEARREGALLALRELAGSIPAEADYLQPFTRGLFDALAAPPDDDWPCEDPAHLDLRVPEMEEPGGPPIQITLEPSRSRDYDRLRIRFRDDIRAERMEAKAAADAALLFDALLALERLPGCREAELQTRGGGDGR